MYDSGPKTLLELHSLACDETHYQEQKSHKRISLQLLFVAQPRLRLRFCDPADGESDPLGRRSLEDSAFQGGALERGAGPVAISEKCQKVQPIQHASLRALTSQ